MHRSDTAAVYHPRDPKSLRLWLLLRRHYAGFAFGYEENFVKEYGFLRPVASDVVHGYLKCGDLRQGFAR